MAANCQGAEQEAAHEEALRAALSPQPPQELSPISESDEDAGLRVYKALLTALFAELSLYADRQAVLLDPTKQLLAYKHAAVLYEARDLVLASLRCEEQEVAGRALPSAYQRAVDAVRAEMQARNTMPRSTALRGKRVFGHHSAIRPLRLPNLPECTHCVTVYLPERPRSGHPVTEPACDGKSLLNFQGLLDPLGELDAAGLAFVLSLRQLEPGAHVVISPFIANAEDAYNAGFFAPAGSASVADIREQMVAFIAKDINGWLSVTAGEEGRWLTESSLRGLRQILKATGSKSASEARTCSAANLTPVKHTKLPRYHGMDNSTKAQSEHIEVSPQQESTPSAKLVQAETVAQQTYFMLMSRLFRSLNFSSSGGDGGWLDAKKQLMIYYHAAKFAEDRDAVITAIRGDEEATAAAGLLEAHHRVVLEARAEVVAQLAAAGEKVKRIFGHEHVIRFHQPPKGLPVPRNSCIFLRELPQVTSYNLQHVTPFRDLLKFRSQGNVLTMLEEHGLALVLYVTDRSPKAFLVISPLFEQPELVEEALATRKGWAEHAEKMKEHLVLFVSQHPEAWLSFIQRHADVMSKESLRTMQRILKGCKIGADANAAAIGELEQQLKEAMHAWEEARLRNADAEGHAIAAAFAAAESRNAAAVAECQKAAADSFLVKREEEVACLVDSNSALLDSVANAEKRASKQQRKASMFRRKIPVLKQLLKAVKVHHETEVSQVAKELSSAQLAISEARHSETEMRIRLAVKEDEVATASKQHEVAQRELSQLQSTVWQLQSAMEEARAQAGEAASRVTAAESTASDAQLAEARARAELELKLDTLQRLTAANVQLRADDANIKEELAASELAASGHRAAEQKLHGELEQKEAQCSAAVQHHASAAAAATAYCESLRVEVARRSEEARLAAERAAELQKAEVQCRMQLQTRIDEVQRLEVAELEMRGRVRNLEEQFSSTTERLADAERASLEASRDKLRARAELEVQAQTVSQLSASNSTLRAEVTRAVATERQLSDRCDEAEARAAEAKRTEAKTLAELHSKSKQAKDLGAQCDSLRVQVEEAAAVLKQSQERAEIAEQSVSHSRNSELRVAAELKVKTEETSALHASCISLRGEVASLQEVASQAAASVAAAEQGAYEAKKAELQAHAELEVHANAVAQLSASNSTLRAEVTRAVAADSQVRDRCDQAEARAKDAKCAEAKALADLHAESEKAKDLAAQCETLRQQVGEAATAAKQSQERAEIAEQSASNSRNSELRVVAELKVKTEETSVLSASCISLRGEVASLSEAKKAELRARAELEVQTEAALQLSASNSTLRAEAAHAVAAESQFRTHCEEAEARAAEATCNKAKVSAELHAKSEEAQALKVQCESLRVQAEEAAATAKQSQERAVIAEQSASRSRSSELLLAAELHAKTEEASALSASCVSLRGQVSSIREEAKQAIASSTATAQLASEANRAATQAKSELHNKTEMLTHLTTLNSELRMEANSARQDAAEASKNLAVADLAALKAREQLEEVRAACDAEIASGKRDVARMESWVEALRSDVDSATSRATTALERARVAEAAAAQSRGDEIRARAELQVKVESIASLEGACHALRAYLAKVRGALASEAERASGAERMVEQLRSQLQVAVDASDLHESEILRIAGNARTDTKASKTTITTLDEQHGELATLEDIEKVLGVGSSDIDRAATKTPQQERQLPCHPVHPDSFDEPPIVSNKSLEPAEQHACPHDVQTGYRRTRTKKADPACMASSHHTKGRPKAKAKGKAKKRAKGKARGKASSVPLRKLHIKTAKVVVERKQSARRASPGVDRAAAAAAAAAARSVTDAGSYQNRGATADAATPKRGQNKQQTKVTPQASKEPRKLRVRSEISKSSTACSAKLRTCDLSPTALI